jgi:hypothetical protein
VRQGCISIGKVECDSCHNIIPYSGRYLLIDEEDGEESETGAESEAGTRHKYCVTCSLDKGYAEYREEKGESVLTFFPIELMPEPEAEPDAVPGESDE